MMSRDIAIGLLPPTPVTPGRARQIAVPPSARALHTLSRVDYEDAFVVETDRAQDRTGEQWARAILEDAPPKMRRALRWGWFALGLRLGSARSARLVLGWEVRHSSPDFALLGTSSRLGMEGEVLVERRQQMLLVTTFVQLKNPIARAVWAQVAPRHRRVVRHLLQQASRRERDQ
jgi:hypothetical protein